MFASLCFGVVVVHSVSALTYQSSTNVGFTFNPTISISLSGDLLISSLSPGSTSDSNIIDVAINTNASQGYTLTATAGTSSTTTNLVNTGNNNNIFTSIATNATITDWTNANDNTWGYSYSEDNGTTWISGKDINNNNANILGYSGLPLDNDDNGATGKTLISTTLPSDNKTLKFKIGAKASSSQASGDYTNIINFYAVANPEPSLTPVSCPAGKICYNANSLTTVQGEMGQQSATNNSTQILYAPNFKNDGYGFAGWSDDVYGNGTKYGPNQTITAPSDVQTTGLSLYAIWVPSAGDMQSWTGCNSLTKSQVTALKDSRDNNVYAVAKLADNKCWMIENLRLDDTPELSSTNTHNPSLPLTNIYDFSSTSNHLSPTSSLAYDATTAPEGWCTTDSSTCDDQSRLRTDNTILFTNNTASSYYTESNVYSYGNYYNWYSATAGHGKYNNGSGYDIYIAPGDICPAGWHLPTGVATTGEFALLDIALGGTGAYSGSNTAPTGTDMSKIWRSYPNNFVYSGNVYGSSVSSRSSSGSYLSSSTFSSSNYADVLGLGSGTVGPANGAKKNEGRMVRCVAGT